MILFKENNEREMSAMRTVQKFHRKFANFLLSICILIGWITGNLPILAPPFLRHKEESVIGKRCLHKCIGFVVCLTLLSLNIISTMGSTVALKEMFLNPLTPISEIIKTGAKFVF